MITKLTLYPESDGMYIQFTNKAFAYGKNLDDKRHIFFAADDTPIGIDLMNVSGGVDTTDLPERKAIEEVLKRHNIKVFAPG